jgi:DNA processing protein
MPTRNLVDWVSLSLLPGLGPISIGRALERFDDPGEVAHRVPARLLASLRGGVRGAERIVDARKTLRRRAEREVRRAEKLGLSLLVRGEASYPAALAELNDAPILLYVRGRLSEGRVRIAVIGSRRATLYGKRVAAGLGSGLAAREIDVVSGGARGIDTCAHRGALEVDGRTLVVLGSGFDKPYPEENAELFERIAERGAILSEFPLATGPKAENFPRRNRVISGLSAAIVVVEAARRSGSLVTAGHALDQGREVLAIPGPVTSGRSTGTNWLIQQGAKLVQNVEDIVEELSPLFRGALPAGGDTRESREENLAGLLPDERTVLEMLDPVEPQQLDALAERAPFGFARLQAALFGLELRGALDVQPGHHYSRKPAPSRSPSGGASD